MVPNFLQFSNTKKMLINFGKNNWNLKNVNKIQKCALIEKNSWTQKYFVKNKQCSWISKKCCQISKNLFPLKQNFHMFQKVCAILKNVCEFEKNITMFSMNFKNVHNFNSMFIYLKNVDDFQNYSWFEKMFTNLKDVCKWKMKTKANKKVKMKQEIKKGKGKRKWKKKKKKETTKQKRFREGSRTFLNPEGRNLLMGRLIGVEGWRGHALCRMGAPYAPNRKPQAGKVQRSTVFHSIGKSIQGAQNGWRLGMNFVPVLRVPSLGFPMAVVA